MVVPSGGRDEAEYAEFLRVFVEIVHDMHELLVEDLGNRPVSLEEATVVCLALFSMRGRDRQYRAHCASTVFGLVAEILKRRAPRSSTASQQVIDRYPHRVDAMTGHTFNQKARVCVCVCVCVCARACMCVHW